MRRSLREDAGFTLTEMMVVLIILGIIMAATYMMVGTSDGMTKTSDRFSLSATEFATPMDVISRFTMQQTQISNPTPYSVEVWTDRDMDSDREKNLFKAGADGKLIWERWEYDRFNNATVLSHETFTMSTVNANVAESLPLFRYYEKDGTEITDMTRASSDTFTMTATIVIDLGNGTVDSDTRHITFRNKS